MGMPQRIIVGVARPCIDAGRATGDPFIRRFHVARALAPRASTVATPVVRTANCGEPTLVQPAGALTFHPQGEEARR